MAQDSVNKMAFTSGFLALFMILCISQAYSLSEPKMHPVMKSPYTSGMEELQSKIKYQFKDQVLLTRAMTHASFSQDNNGAFSVLGSEIIDSAISLRYLWKNSAISKRDLTSQKANLSNCGDLLKDAFDLQLHELIRVAPKIDPKARVIACGCYRALFGAIGVDSRNLDTARGKFWIRQGWNSIKNVQKHFPQDLSSEILDDFE